VAEVGTLGTSGVSGVADCAKLCRLASTTTVKMLANKIAKVETTNKMRGFMVCSS
jgi:hypothetical protein